MCTLGATSSWLALRECRTDDSGGIPRQSASQEDPPLGSQGNVVLLVVIIEDVDHMEYLVKAINKGRRRGVVSVTDGRSDGIELPKTHILSEPKGGSSCDADCLGRPPLLSVRYSLKASHEEVAPKVHV